MANPDFDEMASTTLDIRMKVLVDCIHTETFLLNKLERTKVAKTGGLTLISPIIYQGNHTGKWFSGYQTLPTEPSKHVTSMQVGWASHAAVVTICHDEMKLNRGEHAIIDLLGTRIQMAELGIRRDWQDIIINGDGSDPRAPHGLPHILSDGPYGGIDPSVKGCEFWKPYIVDPLACWVEMGGDPAEFTEPPLTWEVFTDAFMCVDGGRSRPDCLVLSKDLYQGLVASLQPRQTFTNPDMAKLGFNSINYMGVDISYDLDLPAGTGYGLNMDYMQLCYQSDCYMTSSGFKEPIDQAAKLAHILSMWQLKTNNRCAHIVFCNFKPAC